MTTDRIASARRSSLLAFFGALGLVAAALTGCNQSGGGNGTSTVVNTTPSISLVSGNSQSGLVNTALPAPLQVLVKDAGGKPLANQTVTFAVTAGGGTLSAGQATTGAVGTAAVTLTLGKTAGTNTVTATLTGATGSPVTFSETGVFGGATKIVASVSNLGCSVNGTATLTAVVTDAANNPVQGVLVSFTPPASGGTLSATSATTDAQGHASVTFTGTALGNTSVTATANGVGGQITFTITVSPSASAPIVSNITVVANSSATVAPPTIVGATAIQYTLTTTTGNNRANVQIQIDAGDGKGFRPATEAIWAPGTQFKTFNVEGTLNRPTSAAGTTHVFLWDSSADARTATSNAAQIQIVATAQGNPGAPVTKSGLSIQNGGNFGTAKTSTLAGKIPAGSTVLATADMNLDGILDLVTLDATGKTVGIYKGDGLGGFTAMTTTPATLTVGTSPGAVAIADLDKNGLPDIVVFNAGTNDLTILLQGPAGTFTATTIASGLTAPGANATLSLALADVENTGNLDILYASSTSAQYSVVKQWSPGNFIAGAGGYPYALPANPTGLAVADVNSDGKVDLIASTANGVAVIVSQATPAAQTFAAGTNPSALALGDVNGDGQIDIVVANKGSNNVSVLLGAGSNATTATFAAAVNFAVGTAPGSVVLADLDGDGSLDIVTANSGASNLSYLQNQTSRRGTTPKFAAAVSQTTGGAPTGIVAADFDRDGSVDLVTVDATTPDFTFLPFARNAHVPSFVSGATTSLSSATSSATYSKIFVLDLNDDGKIDVVACDDRVSGTGAFDIFLGSGGGQFAAPTKPAGLPAFLRGVVIGDFDGDGVLDIACGDSSGHKVDVFLGDGKGGFGAAQAFTTIATLTPEGMAAADIDGDGKLDLIVLDLSATPGVQFLKNASSGKGNATFTDMGRQAVGKGPVAVKVADVNGDGKPDFAVLNQTDKTVSVYLNGTAKGAATATYSAKSYVVGTAPADLVFLDANGDGHPDIVVSNSGDNDLSALFGDGAGGFAAGVHFGSGQGPAAMATGDLNNDGKPDLVVCDGAFFATSLTVLLGGFPGGLVSKPDLIVASSPSAAAIADLDGDGNNDVLVAMGSTISIVRGNGTADFTSSASTSQSSIVSVGSSPRSVVVADLDLDGIPDLIVANYYSAQLTVAYGLPTGGFGPATTTTFNAAGGGGLGYGVVVAVADVNQDGKPDILLLARGTPDQLAVFLQASSGNRTFVETDYNLGTTGGVARGMAVADVNGDGIPDVVTANLTDGTFSVLLGSPSGAFTSLIVAGNPGPFSYGNATGAYAVAVRDVNHDGFPDIAIVNGDGTVSVLAGPTFQTNLTVATPPNAGVASPSFASVALVDLNRDGNLDLAVAITNGSAAAKLVFFAGNGTGAFPATPTVTCPDPTITGATSLAVGDLNGDGFLDVVLSNNSLIGPSASPDAVSLLLQDKTATFQFAATLTPPTISGGAGTTPFGVVITDVNRDGAPDVVVGNSGAGTVQVFQQR